MVVRGQKREKKREAAVLFTFTQSHIKKQPRAAKMNHKPIPDTAKENYTGHFAMFNHEHVHKHINQSSFFPPHCFSSTFY